MQRMGVEAASTIAMQLGTCFNDWARSHDGEEKEYHTCGCHLGNFVTRHDLRQAQSRRGVGPDLDHAAIQAVKLWLQSCMLLMHQQLL